MASTQSTTTTPDLNAISTWTQADYALLTSDVISAMSNAQIQQMLYPEWVPVSAVSGFTSAQMPVISSFHSCSAAWLNNLSITAWQSMTPQQFYYITRPVLAAVDDVHLSSLTAAQVAYTNKLDGLSSAQFGLLNISALSASQISGLTQTEYNGITSTQIASLSTGQIQALSHQEWLSDSVASGFTANQVPFLNFDFSLLTPSWLNNLSTSALQALSPTQLNQIAANTLSSLDDTHLSALTGPQVGTMNNLDSLNSSQYGLLNLSGLSAATIADWTQSQYAGITAAQITSLNNGQIQAIQHPDWLPVTAIAGFTSEQLPALSVNFSLFTADWLNNLTTSAFRGVTVAQLNQIDPTILVGLDNNHLSALSSAQVGGMTNVNALSSAQFGLLDISALPTSAWTTTQYSGLTAQQVSTLTPEQIKAMAHADLIPATASSGLTAAQVAVISSGTFYYYYSAWLNNLSLSAFQALTPAQINKIQSVRLVLVDNAHLSALTAVQVAGMTHLSVLSGAQFALLNLSGVSAATLNALSTTQLQSITATQIAEISATTLTNLDSAHLAVINEKQTYLSLTAQQVSALSLAQIQALAHPEWIPVAALSGLTPAQISAFTTSLAACPADWFNHLSIPTLQAIGTAQISQLSAATLSGLDSTHLSALTATQMASLTTSLATLPAAWFNGLSIPAFQALSASELNPCTPAVLSGLDNSHVSALTAAQLGGMTTSFSSFSANWLNALNVETLKAVSVTQLNQISTANLAGLDDAHLSILTAAQVGAMTHLSSLSSAQYGLLDISLLPTSAISGWSSTQYQGLTAKQISSLSVTQLNAMGHANFMTASAAAGFTAAQISGFTFSLYWFSSDWLNNLTPSAIQALSPVQLNQITTANLQALDNTHLSALTAPQVASITHLSSLSSTQFGALNISALPASVIATLNKTQYTGLTAQQMSTLSSDQIDALQHIDWIPASAASGITAVQMPCFGSAVSQMSPAFINNLSLPAFQALTVDQFAAIKPSAIVNLDSAHLATLTSNLLLLNSDELLSVAPSLSTEQLGLLRQDQSALLSLSGSTGDSLMNSLSDTSLKSIMAAVSKNDASLFSYQSIETVMKTFVASMKDVLTDSQYADLSHYAQSIGTVCGTDSSIYSLVSGMVTGNNGASVDWTSPVDGTLTRIGCLGVGSSATQFNQLIANWLDGTNMPASSSTAYTDGRPLFAEGGPSINDIHQGQDGDCSLLSALQGVVDADPNFIKSMIVQNSNDTYSVRFFNNGVPTWVTVDNNVYSKGAHVATSSWVAIAERANVAFEATYQNDVNSYSSLPGSYEKLKEITGDTYTSFRALTTTEQKWDTTDFDLLKTAVSNGAPAQLSSWVDSKDAVTGQTNFVSAHAFAIIGFDETSNNFILTNPWGADRNDSVAGTFEASMDQMWQSGNSSTGIAFVNSNGATGAAGQLVTAMASITSASSASSASSITQSTTANNGLLVANNA